MSLLSNITIKIKTFNEASDVNSTLVMSRHKKQIDVKKRKMEKILENN